MFLFLQPVLDVKGSRTDAQRYEKWCSYESDCPTRRYLPFSLLEHSRKTCYVPLMTSIAKAKKKGALQKEISFLLHTSPRVKKTYLRMIKLKLQSITEAKHK